MPTETLNYGVRNLFFDTREEALDYIQAHYQNATIQRVGVTGFDSGYRVSRQGVIIAYLHID